MDIYVTGSLESRCAKKGRVFFCWAYFAIVTIVKLVMVYIYRIYIMYICIMYMYIYIYIYIYICIYNAI